MSNICNLGLAPLAAAVLWAIGAGAQAASNVPINAGATTQTVDSPDVETTARSANASSTIAGGNLTINGGSLVTRGDYAHAAYAHGGIINLDGTRIMTRGTWSYGAYADGGGTLNIKNSQIGTNYLKGYAVYASAGTVNMENTDVTTNYGGANAVTSGAAGMLTMNGGNVTSAGYGLIAHTKGNIVADGVTVSVMNKGYSGLFANAAGSSIIFNNGQLTLGNSGQAGAVTTGGSIALSQVAIKGDSGTGLSLSGSSSITGSNVGINLDNSGGALPSTLVQFAGVSGDNNSLTLQDSNLIAQGTDAIGINASVGSNTATLSNTQLNTIDGTTINVVDSDLTLNASGSTLSGKNLLTAFSGNALINAIQGSVLNGDVTDSGATRSTLNLDDSMWTGASSGLQTLALNNNSQWDVTQSGNVGSITLDNSTINMTAEGTGYSKLTVGSLTSRNGTVEFKTHLMGDDSQTDQLHVTGDYSGDTGVVVKNAGGTGAQTLNGINLIQVDGKVDGTFTQKGRIVAGAYDYFLKQGTDANRGMWYLDSTPSAVPVIKPIYPVDPVTPPVDSVTPPVTPPVDPVTPPVKPPVAPIAAAQMTVRPEAGSYMANLAAANTLFTTSQDDRMGETRYIDPVSGEEHSTSLWLRNEGGHSRSKDSSGQLKTTGNRYVMQLGGDVGQWTRNGDDRFNLGVMGGYASAQSNTHSNVTGYGSKGDIHGYSAGVYGGWQQDNVAKTGAYLDSWALYNWFDNSVKGDDIGEESYKSKGITASLEGGYTFEVGELNARQSYYLQPKAQVTWMGVKADDHREGNGTRVTGSGDNNVQTRLGLRAFMKGHSLVDEGKGRTFEPFVEANWIHNTDSFGSTLNGVNVSQAGGRDIGELKVGVDAKVSNRVNLWGNIGQQLGDKGYSDSSASIGVKVNF